MKNRISIREAVTENEVKLFWEKLREYFVRDIFPEDDEDRAYFLGEEYFQAISAVHDREVDKCRYLFFERNGETIGFAMPAIFASEDGKCFIMEFCVFPEFRGNGCGVECADAIMDWCRERGAQYFELNSGGNPRRENFWKKSGFVNNGFDEWGEPLMLLPPEEEIPISVQLLEEADDWQLKKLENGFLKEIGEEVLSEDKQEALAKAVKEGKITFFIARRGSRAVGMCSVAEYWSTFSCAETGVFEDFYIEPAFRGKGIARMLAQEAQKWCAERRLSSLAVCCAPCDEEMYKSLGFDTALGKTLAHI
ncbi:MAG: GNAT family N-acetyltransferase [Oscillospiraceae bacterium]|nr:GNAT family N-acetyltransferase [Oscillospiraceae bacterium]